MHTGEKKASNRWQRKSQLHCGHTPREQSFLPIYSLFIKVNLRGQITEAGVKTPEKKLCRELKCSTVVPQCRLLIPLSRWLHSCMKNTHHQQGGHGQVGNYAFASCWPWGWSYAVKTMGGLGDFLRHSTAVRYGAGTDSSAGKALALWAQ